MSVINKALRHELTKAFSSGDKNVKNVSLFIFETKSDYLLKKKTVVGYALKYKTIRIQKELKLCTLIALLSSAIFGID